MAKLVAVCRDEEFPFERRQIPLMIEETLTVSCNHISIIHERSGVSA